MFTRVLVANRGEIAVRIIKTLRTLGVRSVLAASVPDRHGLAARLADEVVLLGGSSAADTYLDVAAIVDAAKSADCEAIHPGYGFLSESPLLAEACAGAGMTFVGPSVEVLRTLGDKATARRLAVANGIPVVPGWDGDGDDDELLEHANELGFPLMVKARGGGGGRGMRRVDAVDGLLEAVQSAKREAASAFGDGRVFIEQCVTDAHHVEVQVLADAHGAMVHLGERDCSVQRRHQKLIEETPSPIVDDPLRERLTSAALRLMRAAKYANAGTVEFLVGPAENGDRPCYFIEVNPRLQVEHTVTEEVTGLDLVELQLRVASGEVLPLTQDQIEFNGHAIEFRINAEDPNNDFKPSPGRITSSFVDTLGGIGRFDSGFEAGDVIPPHYDSLLGKLIVHAESRDDALWLASETMRLTHFDGVLTNLELCKALVRSQRFQSQTATTDWLETGLTELIKSGTDDVEDEDWVSAAANLLSGQDGVSAKWFGAGTTSVFVTDGRETRRIDLSFSDARTGSAATEEHHYPFRLDSPDSRRDDPVPVSFSDSSDVSFGLGKPPALPRRVRSAEVGRQSVLAPLAGTITGISVLVDQDVDAGDLLLVLEAMKMEHRVTAPTGGTVRELNVENGRVVAEGDVLVVLG